VSAANDQSRPRRPGAALVTGVTGQDGVHLARLLRSQGVAVIGTRQDDAASRSRAAAYLPDVDVRVHDLLDPAGFGPLLSSVRPTRIFHLAGSTSVAQSWQDPATTAAVNDHAVARLLDDVRRVAPEARVFVASSAVVGRDPSPYAASKLAAEQHVRDARDAGLWAVSARLHNHESPLREPQFVTRKITRAAASIALGLADSLTLGNTAVRRDWGHARDHVEAMRRMLEQDSPTDLEIGTGVAHGLTDLVDLAFAAAGLGDASAYLRTDDALLRPGDADEQVADPEPAAAALGWRATTSFEEMVEHLVRVDLARLRTGVEHDPAYLDLS
jgi:GDPmannose 4,6-dehydratase